MRAALLRPGRPAQQGGHGRREGGAGPLDRNGLLALQEVDGGRAGARGDEYGGPEGRREEQPDSHRAASYPRRTDRAPPAVRALRPASAGQGRPGVTRLRTSARPRGRCAPRTATVTRWTPEAWRSAARRIRKVRPPRGPGAGSRAMHRALGELHAAGGRRRGAAPRGGPPAARRRGPAAARRGWRGAPRRSARRRRAPARAADADRQLGGRRRRAARGGGRRGRGRAGGHDEATGSPADSNGVPSVRPVYAAPGPERDRGARGRRSGHPHAEGRRGRGARAPERRPGRPASGASASAPAGTAPESATPTASSPPRLAAVTRYSTSSPGSRAPPSRSVAVRRQAHVGRVEVDRGRQDPERVVVAAGQQAHDGAARAVGQDAVGADAPRRPARAGRRSPAPARRVGAEQRDPPAHEVVRRVQRRR